MCSVQKFEITEVTLQARTSVRCERRGEERRGEERRGEERRDERRGEARRYFNLDPNYSAIMEYKCLKFEVVFFLGGGGGGGIKLIK